MYKRGSLALVILLILVILLVTGTVGFFLFRRATVNETPSPATNQITTPAPTASFPKTTAPTPTTLPSSSNSNCNIPPVSRTSMTVLEALKKVKEKYPDYKKMTVISASDVYYATESGPTAWDVGAAEPSNGFYVTFEVDSTGSVRMTVPPWNYDSNQSPSDSLPSEGLIDSPQALEIAKNAARDKLGSNYLNCAKISLFELILPYSYKTKSLGDPFYAIYFFSRGTKESDVDVKINAKTGQVLSVNVVKG